jgi:hypothetical protein
MIDWECGVIGWVKRDLRTNLFNLLLQIKPRAEHFDGALILIVTKIVFERIITEPCDLGKRW